MTPQNEQALREILETTSLSDIRAWLHEISPTKSEPIDHVLWVPMAKVIANDYNPNSVARIEMRLLYVSIQHDGYTQPIVTVRDDENDRWVIVDGFHRRTVMAMYADIAARTDGLLPIVVIHKSLAERMSSTVRHNRARGKHSIAGMSSMVFQMLEQGMEDHEICNELGMEPEEILRLKHITGFSKLFENAEYSRAWKTKRMILAEKKFRDSQASPK